jgi:hypothetical protein
MAVLEYGIFSRQDPIRVQLEIKLEAQLEGDADVWFSRGDGPNDSVVSRTFPWRLEGI